LLSIFLQEIALVIAAEFPLLRVGKLRKPQRICKIVVWASELAPPTFDIQNNVATA